MLQEKSGQAGDVLAPLAQGGQLDADDVQAVEQVLAKAPLAHQHLQVLVRGGNDAHIGTDGGVPAHAVKAALGQHAQQARLRLEWHVANLIEKQRAALGLLKAALALGGGPGEGTALVAEQFGLDQVARDGRHVQRNKGRGAARAVAVQGLGDQLFAGA